MWRTSTGDRTLVGKEAELVLAAVGHLREMISAAVELNAPYQTDVEIFNVLQPTQQLAVLHEVAFALLDEDVPDPELTAIREATIFVLFCELHALVEMEIQWSERKNQPGSQLRSLITEVILENRKREGEWDSDSNTEFDDEVIAAECNDPDEWRIELNRLADEILWDHDFELESLFADHDPEKVRDLKQHFGIGDNYFAIPAPDSNSEEYRRLDQELVQLAVDQSYSS